MTISTQIPGERILLDPSREGDRYFPKASLLQLWAKKRRFKAYQKEKLALTRRVKDLRDARVGTAVPVQVILCLSTDPMTHKVLEFVERWARNFPMVKILKVEEFSCYSEVTLPKWHVLVTGQCLTYEAPGIGRFHKMTLDLDPDLLARFQLPSKKANFNEPANTGWALQEIAFKLTILILSIIARELELAG